MHGMAAAERVSTHHAVWLEFLNVLEILNIEVHKQFAEHFIMGVQKDPVRNFRRDLMQLYIYAKTTRPWQIF